MEFNINGFAHDPLPVDSDGVICHHRLHWLAHVMGHELIHVLVDRLCGRNYAGHDGHSMYFMRLNNRIMGHSSHYHISQVPNVIQVD